MEKISISPVEWSHLKDIDEISPVGEADYACIRDVRDVLRHHGMLDRFGLALLHSHFDLDDDEIWVEECDDTKRVLTTRPMKTSEASEQNVGTIWHLRDGDIQAAKWCRKYCAANWLLGHTKNCHA